MGLGDKVTVYGEPLVVRFAKKHPYARKPLARFLEIARNAQWKHMPDVKATFSATDFDPHAQLFIFDIGGNKYRLTARLDFKSGEMFIKAIMTHEEYNREG